MERLTEKQSAGYDLKAMNGDYCEAYCRQQNYNSCRECGIYEAIQKLAEYEDLEEQGLLLRLPCKVWDVLYIVNPLCWNEDERILIGVCRKYLFNDLMGWCVGVELEKSVKSLFRVYAFSDFGKTVFLTREAAEAKLKELEGKE